MSIVNETFTEVEKYSSLSEKFSILDELAMPGEIVLGTESLSPRDLWRFARESDAYEQGAKIRIARRASERMLASARYVQKIVKNEEKTYGINTGFGFFADKVVPPADLEKLQYNIIRSHCCGVGEALPRDLAMGLWLINLNKLAQGYSGIRMETMETIISHLEHGILADIPSRGSVGASGDLAPAAHAARACLGEGNCTYIHNGELLHGPAAEALQRMHLPPVKLGPKEGLSLVNGTALSTILAVKAWCEGEKLLRVANMASAMMTEALGGNRLICNDLALKVHRHEGTLACGREIAKWLGPMSEMAKPHAENHWVQDPYCIRCAPQVHGAVYTTLRQAEEVLQREINAATDNPLIFPEEGEVVNCGHFHAIYPSRVSDSLASAFATLANISERRINQAMCAKRKHLPTFLVEDGGLNSGFMMIHVTAAALVSEAKTLCFPASVDSIPTNVQQEDHVSMGPNAGYKALKIVDLLRDVLSIELFCAAQCFDLLKPLKPSEQMLPVYDFIREMVPFIQEDCSLAENVAVLSEALKGDEIDELIDFCLNDEVDPQYVDILESEDA